MMDIFDFAIQMERDGERFYREVALKTAVKDFQNIFVMLADDEKKHARIIRDIQTQAPHLKETRILDTAKNVFQQMKDFGGKFDLSGDEENVYRQAMEMEQKSIGFYLDRADQVQIPEQRALFQQLAVEEKKHFHVLENLADFVANPKTYLADAEFSNLGDY